MNIHGLQMAAYWMRKEEVITMVHLTYLSSSASYTLKSARL